VFMIDGALDIVHGCIRHAASLKDIQPLFRRLCLELVLDDTVERVSVLDPQCIRNEASVCLPLWLVDLVAQYAVELVVAAADGDVGVFGLVGSVWDHRSYFNLSAHSQEEVSLQYWRD
jgi:hypothetical protein